MAEAFITKDSGQRENYTTGMVRDTQEGKARFSLLRPKGVPYDEQFLTRCAMLMTRGAEKYGMRNWEKAHTQEELDRFEDSAERHLQQYLAGDRTEDHAAAVFFNLQAAETCRYKIKVGWHSDDCECEKPNPEFYNPFKIEGLTLSITGPTFELAPAPIQYHHHVLDAGSITAFAGPVSDWHAALPPHRHSGTALMAHDPARLVGTDNHTIEPESCGCSAAGPCFTHR